MSHERHRVRTLWLTGILHAFTHLYQVALLPLYLRIQQELGLHTVEQATLLVSVMGLAYYGASYPMGVLADRCSRKKLLAAGLGINGLGFVCLGMSPNYSGAVASALLAGLGGSFFHPSATPLVAHLFPEARGRALGLVGIGASAGFFLGPFYSGWRVMASGNWRAPILELGIAGVVMALLFLWLADEDPAITAGIREPAPQSRKFLVFADLKGLFSTGALWACFFGACVALSLRDFAGGAMGTASSLFLQYACGFTPKAAGFALSGIYIASAISNPVFGGFSDAGRMRWLSFVLIVAAGLAAAFPHVPVAWMGPALVVYGFFFISSYPMTEAALMEAVPDAVRGRVFGLFITVTGLLSNVSHWAVGSWVERLGPGAKVVSNYFPLYGVLSLLVIVSLAGLPCLRALGRVRPGGIAAMVSPQANL